MKYTFALNSDIITTWLIQKNEDLIHAMEIVVEEQDSLEKDLTMLAIHVKMTILEELTDLICSQGDGTLH